MALFQVEKQDFERAQRGIVPASQRAVAPPGRKLPNFLEPLLGQQLASIVKYVNSVFPPSLHKHSAKYVYSPYYTFLVQIY